MFDLLKKEKGIIALFLPFFLFFSSCSQPACNRWEWTTFKVDYPCITFAKAYYPPSNNFNGIEVEWVRSGGEHRLYLNAMTLQFPCADDQTVDVSVCIEGEEYHFVAAWLQGGQRLLLGDDAQELIISTLFEGCPVDISVGRYHTTVTSDNFAKIYDRMF